MGGLDPFQTQGEDPLDAVVNVRLRAAETPRLCEEAEMTGLGVSGPMRSRAFSRPARTDQVMIRELRHLGRLIKRVHTTSGCAYSQETSVALAALKAVVARLNDDRQKG